MKTLLAISALSFAAATHLPAEAPTVIINLLDHTDQQKTKYRFWIDWRKTWRGIVSSKSISGEDAEKLIQQLRVSLENTEAEHFCGHDPIYGIQATTPDGGTLKTSLCFSCTTWVKPGQRLNISGKMGADNELCQMLRKHIELPPELQNEGPLKPQKR